jgi:hypothetical protein
MTLGEFFESEVPPIMTTSLGRCSEVLCGASSTKVGKTVFTLWDCLSGPQMDVACRSVFRRFALPGTKRRGLMLHSFVSGMPCAAVITSSRMPARLSLPFLLCQIFLNWFQTQLFFKKNIRPRSYQA